MREETMTYARDLVSDRFRRGGEPGYKSTRWLFRNNSRYDEELEWARDNPFIYLQAQGEFARDILSRDRCLG